MKSTHPSQLHRTFTAILILSSLLALIYHHPVSAAPPTHHYYVDTIIDSQINNSGCLDAADTNTCSLRGAIQLANAGDLSDWHQIHLQADTYLLTIPGYDDSNAWGDLDVNGPFIIISGVSEETTVIQASGSFDRIIDHQGSHALKLMNLTIEHGSLPTGHGGGAGVRSLSTGILTLESMRITDNHITGSDGADIGGGLYIYNTNLSTSSTIIDHNSACHGGGVAISDSAPGATSSFSSSDVNYNTAICGNGGGIYTLGAADVDFITSNLYENHGKNGAGYYDSSNTILTMNDALVDGGIIDTGGLGAGGMEIFGSATLDNVRILNNIALSGPGGIRLNHNSVFSMTNSRLHDNEGSFGGGIEANNNTSASLENVEITHNIAEVGGGLAIGANADMDLVNVTIADNEASFGGGIYLYNNTSANLNHVTVAGNLGDTHGDAVYIDYNGHWDVDNSILYWSAGGDVCYYADLSYTVGSNIHTIENADTCKLAGMVNTDPQLGGLGYYGATTRSMRPLPGSPAIDGAVTSDPVTTDQRGKTRIDGDLDGVIKSDIGAHEHYLQFFLPVILNP